MKRQQGYTLIELLLYLAITSVLLASLTAFFAMTLSVRTKNESINEVNQQGQLVMDSILQTVRNADSITVPATGFTTGTTTLAMTTAAINPTVISLSGATLQIKEGSSTAVALTNSRVIVSGLTIKNVSRSSTTPGSVQVGFTVSAVNTTGRNEYDYQKTFIGSASLR